MIPNKTLSALAGAALLAIGLAQPAFAAGDKIVIAKQADLPRFSYKIPGTATRFVEADAKDFDAFAAQVGKDIDGILAGYQIDDKSTMAELLGAKLSVQELAGDYAGGLKTIDQLRALQTKPAAQALTGLVVQARLQAAIDAGGESGPAFEAAFRKHYNDAVAPLPWAVVKDGVKGGYGYSRIAGRASTLAGVTTELDPAAAKSGALDAPEAWDLIGTRVELKYGIPMATARADVLHAYIAKNDTPVPEIWTQREVTLTAADKLTPVNVAIWDSGVDVAIFPKQLFNDPHPTASGTHGLAFDDLGNPSKDWTYPISKAQKGAYPTFQQVQRGRIDLQKDRKSTRLNSSHI